MRPTAPTVPITLDRERHLLLDFNAIAHAEEATRRNLLSTRTLMRVDATLLTALLWGALLHEDPQLTLADVRRLVTFRNVAAVNAAVNEALRLAFSEPEEGESDADPLAPASLPAGSTSGASPASTSA